MNFKSRKGGAALEYVFVTLFGLSVAIILLNTVGSKMKQRLLEFAEANDITLDDFSLPTL